MSRCKSCGAEIAWVTTTNGKKMPIDIKQKTIMTPVPVNAIDVRYAAITGHESHFATCPNADRHRRKK